MFAFLEKFGWKSSSECPRFFKECATFDKCCYTFVKVVCTWWMTAAFELVLKINEKPSKGIRLQLGDPCNNEIALMQAWYTHRFLRQSCQKLLRSAFVSSQAEFFDIYALIFVKIQFLVHRILFGSRCDNFLSHYLLHMHSFNFIFAQHIFYGFYKFSFHHCL